MGNSKVIYGGETVIDLTEDTVTPDKLARGTTAHNAAGDLIAGTATEVDLVQETGNSETAVMSQKAVTKELDGLSEEIADEVTARGNAIAEVKSQIGQLQSGNELVSVPSYWEAPIAEAIAKVREIQNTGGNNVFHFIHFTDMHYKAGGTNYTNNIGAVARKLMDALGIPLIIGTGDITESSAAASSAQIDADVSEAFATFEVAGLENLLYCKGNHDGAWGAKATYGVNYAMIQHPKKLWNRLYRWQAKDFRRVFSDDGSYYYVDNIPQKVRYIVLNSHWADYSNITDADYDSQATEYNTQKNINYGDAQAEWLATVALDFKGEDGWHVVVPTHAPMWNKFNGVSKNYMNVQYAGTNNASTIRNILMAFYNKTSVEYRTGKSVDFSNVGESCTIAGVWCGHCHTDFICKHDEAGTGTDIPFPIVSTTSAGHVNSSYEEDFGMPVTTRTLNSATETAFDIVSINKATKRIYTTRIGAGNDRSTFYGDAVTHSVSISGTGITSATYKVIEGENLTVTLVATDGYNLPSSVAISGNYGSYTFSNGVLTITNVQGDCAVTGTGTVATKTLTSISATYSGGSVPVGTAVTSLTGITVTGHYSDGSTGIVTGYTLSGSISTAGNNTVTISYGGKTTTITVVGTAVEPSVPNVVLNTNVFDSTADGFMDNSRFSSSAASNGYIGTGTTQFVTNYIRIDKGMYLNVDVPGSATQVTTTIGGYMLAYDKDKNRIGTYTGLSGTVSNNKWKYQVNIDNVAYIRLSPYKTANSGITVANCNIVVTES